MADSDSTRRTTAHDLSGQRFGRLVAIERAGRRGSSALWRCACDCGNQKNVTSTNLRRSQIQSCGCLLKEFLRKTFTTHGQHKSPEYRAWAAMVSRCTNQNSCGWAGYGGRGIKVCDRWLNFADFFADLGKRPPGTSLDRINNDGNYEPGNCRWATAKQQMRNRRNCTVVEYDGRQITIAELSEITGIPHPTLSGRYHKGLRGSALIQRPK